VADSSSKKQAAVPRREIPRTFGAGIDGAALFIVLMPRACGAWTGDEPAQEFSNPTLIHNRPPFLSPHTYVGVIALCFREIFLHITISEYTVLFSN